MELVKARIPLKFGVFDFYAENYKRGQETIILVTPDLDVSKTVNLRIHSECITGDLFHSLKCDCGEQLEKSLELINKSKNGMLIYLRQEGRGIGLVNKLKSYNLQETGVDTHRANVQVGGRPDERNYGKVLEILHNFNVSKVNLISNNPHKIKVMKDSTFSLEKVIPLKVKPGKWNKKYLNEKRLLFKHFSFGKDLPLFISVAGISSKDEVKEVVSKVKPKKKRIFLGITSNSDSFEKVRDIFDLNLKKGFEFVLHYSFKDSPESINKIKTILREIKNLKIIQLNETYDSEIFLKILKEIPKDKTLILPFNSRTKSNFEGSLFEKYSKGKKIYFLVDESEGKGIKIEFKKYVENIYSLLDKGRNNLALAGGLGPENYNAIQDLEDYFKFSFSVDAETKLRTKNKLDMEKVKKYIELLG